jgi:hypothetical protein
LNGYHQDGKGLNPYAQIKSDYGMFSPVWEGDSGWRETHLAIDIVTGFNILPDSSLFP